MNELQFINELKQIGIVLNDYQLDQFRHYFTTLIVYNKKMNLTTIVDKNEVYLKHFYDSLTILMDLKVKKSLNLCDVGAGAGFPSVPLKIVRPDLKITIVDSLGKRVSFLRDLVNVLQLSDIEAIHARAEDYAKESRELFDIVTARAVAKLNMLSELCIPLVKKGGLFIAMKAQNGKEELENAQKGIKIFGCKLIKFKEFLLPNNGGKRNILIFQKINKTPDKYPRNYSQIKNKPL